MADARAWPSKTVYFVFRDKRTLFKDAADTSIAGDTEPVPRTSAAPTRFWAGSPRSCR
ncbi:hypothetical protein AB0G05_14810 [Nonomuraea wenchangensis]